MKIREISPPKDVREAVAKQMSAERTRGAVVTEVDGKLEAAVLVGEGEKQAAILKAHGHEHALVTVFNAAGGIDNKTMANSTLMPQRRRAQASLPNSSSHGTYGIAVAAEGFKERQQENKDK